MMLLNCDVGEDLRVPWTARRSNQSILKEISPEYSLEGLMLKLKLQHFGHLMRRTDSCTGREEGSGWGTHVYLWRIHFDIWQNQYNIVKFKNKIKFLKKYVVLPVVMYRHESWTIKKAKHQKTDAFELWCWRRLLSIPWTPRRSNQSILKEISPE